MPLSVGWLVPYFLLVCVCFPSSHFSYIIVIYSPFRVHACAPRLVECSAILLADWLDEKYESGALRLLSGDRVAVYFSESTDFFRTCESFGYFPTSTRILGKLVFPDLYRVGCLRGARCVVFGPDHPPFYRDYVTGSLGRAPGLHAFVSRLARAVLSAGLCLFPL